MTIEEKIELIAERYGYEPQSCQCIEEMAELTQAISKLRRKRNLEGDDRQIIEVEDAVLDEITGILIMLRQIKYLLGFGEGPLAK